MADDFVLDPSDVLEGETTEETTTTTEETPLEPVEGEEAEPKEGDEGEKPADGEESEDKPKEEGDETEKPPAKLDAKGELKAARDALTKFRDSDPDGNKDVARYLRNQLGHAEAYQQTFPTINEARAARATLDSAGGVEGVANLQAVMADVEESDNLIDSGDPAIFDKLMADDNAKAGLIKLTPHYLAKVRDADYKAYASAIQPHIVQELEGLGLGRAIESLEKAVSDGDDATAANIVKELAAWYRNESQKATSARASMANPDRTKLDGEWTKLNEAKEQTFNQEWQGLVNQDVSKAIWTKVEPYIRGSKLNDKQAKSFTADVIRNITDNLNSDKVYQTQKTALLRSKNRDAVKVANFQKAKINGILGDVVTQVAADRRLTATKGTAVVKTAAAKAGTTTATRTALAAPKTGAGSLEKPIYVAIKPKEHIDKSKDPEDYLEIAGKAFMKSGPYKGKYVSWRRPN